MIRTHIFSLKISLSSLKMDNAAFRKSEELISDIRSSGYFSIFQELNKIEMKTKLVLITVLVIFGIRANAQPAGTSSGKPYAYIIKGGHVIDPKNNINSVMDIAFTAGRRGTAARPAAWPPSDRRCRPRARRTRRGWPSPLLPQSAAGLCRRRAAR